MLALDKGVELVTFYGNVRNSWNYGVFKRKFYQFSEDTFYAKLYEMAADRANDSSVARLLCERLRVSRDVYDRHVSV